MRILGIDPGSRNTGYACVSLKGRDSRYEDSGVLALQEGKQVEAFEKRLLKLYSELDRLICDLKPQCLVVEKVFFAKNAVSALKLGQVRGVVLLMAAFHDLELVEYSATEVKKNLTGHGRASKEQVAAMVQLLSGKRRFATHDASDALALALCHAQHQFTLTRRQGLHAGASTKSKSLQIVSPRRNSLARALGVDSKQNPRRK